jgi:hypothetical protein
VCEEETVVEEAAWVERKVSEGRDEKEELGREEK